MPTEVVFLGEETGKDVAARHGPADLVVANNVFAHVPDIVDFAKGLRRLVADDGTVTIEIPHLLRLIEGNEYDTIYHEHYSYLTLLTTQRVLAEAGLTVVDVEELATHGGLPADLVDARPSTRRSPSAAVAARAGGRGGRRSDTRSRAIAGSRGPSHGCATTSWSSSSRLPREGRRSSPTAPPGKGNTLLNHCGVRADLIAFAVDRNPFKHGQVPAGHPHPDPPAGAARGGAARLRADHAVEPPGRDHRAARLRPRLGRPARRGPARSSRSSRPDGGGLDEGCALLRWSGHAHPRRDPSRSPSR